MDQYIVYNVQYRMYTIQAIIYTIVYRYSLQHIVQCTLNSVHCTVYKIYTIQCTVYSIQCWGEGSGRNQSLKDPSARGRQSIHHLGLVFVIVIVIVIVVIFAIIIVTIVNIILRSVFISPQSAVYFL